ncbi:MAG: DUF4386 domain-containing protein [Actinomycetes bacterium]
MKNARITGIFYLITFITSIPAVFLLDPVLHNSSFITGQGSANSVLWGSLLDVFNAIACVGSAVAIFPIVRKVNLSLAIGFIASRLFEAAIILIGVVSLLAIVSLRADYLASPTTDTSTLELVGSGLLKVRNWTFLLGPGLVPAINGLLLGLLLFKGKLVPKLIPLLGIIGAPMLFASALGTYFGIFDQMSSIAAVAGLPIAAWELSLGVYLTVKGVKSTN